MKLTCDECINFNDGLVSLNSVDGLSFDCLYLIAKNVHELEIIVKQIRNKIEELKKPLLEELKSVPEEEKTVAYSKLWDSSGIQKKLEELGKEEIEVHLHYLKYDEFSNEKVKGLKPNSVNKIFKLIKKE